MKQNNTPKRACIADDDPQLRGLIATSLRREGFIVDELSDGRALRERIEATQSPEAAHLRPDVIVSDVHMPGGGGLQVLSSMRHMDVEIPVVLITAFNGDEVSSKATQLGAAAILEKPVDLFMLRRLVKDLSG